MRLGTYLATLLGLLLAGTALAQPKSAGAGNFEKLIKGWEDVIREIRDIQIEFRLADPDQRPQLRQAYQAKMKQANKMMPKVLAAGEAAYKADPRDEELRDFILQAAQAAYQVRDDYERLARMTSALIANIETIDKRVHPDLYTLAAMAAAETGDIAAAKKYLEAAKRAGDTESAKPLRDALEDGEEEKYWAAEKKARANDAKAKLPRVRIKTTQGDLVVVLFKNDAPNTVANFLHLVQSGYYNGKTFHRVLPHFMIQGGAPNPDGTGDVGYQIACECHGEEFRRHFRGSLSMAHRGKDTGAAQFFICLSRYGEKGVQGLDQDKKSDGQGHTVFGRVIEGMEVLALIQRRDPTEPQAKETEMDKVLSATVVYPTGKKFPPPKKIGDEKEKKKDKPKAK